MLHIQNIPKKVSIEQFKQMIEILNDSMDNYLYIYDIQRDYYCISENAGKRFLLPATEFHNVMTEFEKFVYAEDVPLLTEDLQRILNGETLVHDLQYRWLDQDKWPVWINCRGNVLLDNEGKPKVLIGCINEIGRKQMADNVSGLLGESSLQKDIANCQKAMEGFILRLGIDSFKEINQNKGMIYGDNVLRKTAECISSVILPQQKLYRMVADEFVVVDFAGRTKEDAVELYNVICGKIKEFIEEVNYEVFYTLSAGIVELAPFKNKHYYHFMKRSEFALNEAKERGRNKYYIYKEQDYKIFKYKKELTDVLRNAVNQNFEGFQVFFQPVVDIKEQKVIGAETLLRFSCEEFGFIPPIKFVPLLEESGLIIPVGKWILYQAMEACKNIQAKIPYFRVAVNVSFIQVLRSDVLDDIIKGLERYQLQSRSLLIELTESGFLEDENFVRLCNGLKEYGVPLALDDFGTGYSNFHYLGTLVPNTIKIDRSFTLKALTSDYEYKLLQYMADMTHSIDSKFCIEGIETEEELKKICEMKPDYIQGYYFGRPCPYEVFVENYVK